jgi:hypothetical protein
MWPQRGVDDGGVTLMPFAGIANWSFYLMV